MLVAKELMEAFCGRRRGRQGAPESGAAGGVEFVGLEVGLEVWVTGFGAGWAC